MSTLKTTNLQHASAASPAIVLASDGTATAQLSSLNSGPLAGMRNRIINGAMDFWQRGTSTTTSSVYLADRWQAQFPTGGTVSQETTSVPTGSRYAWKYVASATNAYMQMGQQIEYMNCLDLQNTTVAISFMARSVTSNAGSTALTVRTRTIAGIDGTCLFAGSNSDTAITLTTSWTRYTVTRTLPATFGSLSIEFVLGNSHVSGDGIMLSQIQLESGSVATPFERRSYGQELALCQRYYAKTYNSNVVPGTSTGEGSITCHAFNGAFTRVTWSLPVSMRAVPTGTIYSTTGASVKFRNIDAGVDQTGSIDTGTESCVLTYQHSTSGTGQYLGAQATVSAEL